jgi:oxygen-independent coproporphyrinogen-3 oxidase
MDNWQQSGFGLYVHWPFCQSKCPYCDFNSHVSVSVDQSRWQRAFLSEIERMGQETPGRVLQTIYFGGGTPSLMEPELVSAILEHARSTWSFANDIEITLEANPGSVETGRFTGFREAGVNRVSMGLQAMNDADLKRLGRMHSVQDALLAFEIARKTFDRVSFDLIYARQDQTLKNWRNELSLAIELAVDHLSLYQLTVEDGTVFAARFANGGLKGLPDEDLSADMYKLTQDVCGVAGLYAYEVSNHARTGMESRHNLIYWRGGDYAAIGPGAHGRISTAEGRFATEAPRSPEAWLSAVERRGNGDLSYQLLSTDECALEYLLMCMRLTEGMDIGKYNRLASDFPPGRPWHDPCHAGPAARYRKRSARA